MQIGESKYVRDVAWTKRKSGHILSTCKFNEDLTKQHDYEVKKIAKELTKSNPNARIW